MKKLIFLFVLMISQYSFGFNSRGPEHATIKVIMFGDFECPFTKRGVQNLNNLTKEMPYEIEVIYRHFPLSFHPNAMKAAIASECSAQQGKFWNMHDSFFSSNNQVLDDRKIADIVEEIGLNKVKFKVCMASNKSAENVKRDMNEANLLGLKSTPTFIFAGPTNIKRISGAYPIDELKKIIEEVK